MSLDVPRTPILVTGGQGMLGRALARILGSQGAALGRDQLDISDKAAVAGVLGQMNPRLVINCAAATDVDRCESDREYARAANAEGPAVLAEALCGAADRPCPLVHRLRVRRKQGHALRGERLSQPPELLRPDQALGRGGRPGLGPALAYGPCRPHFMALRTGRTGNGSVSRARCSAGPTRAERIRVVSDQWGSPTYAPFLAKGILALVDADAQGVYHLAGAGCAGRLELAREVVTQAGLDVEIEAAVSAEFPTAAPRPRSTCLDCTRSAELGVSLPPWPEGLRCYLVELLGEGSNAAQPSVRTPRDATSERLQDLS